MSPEQLLQAVQHLSKPEFERFFEKLVEMRSPHVVPRLSLTESELLAKINQPVLPAIQKRHHELMAKRRAQSITEREYDELLVLIDKLEKAEAARVRYLIELAHIRNLTLDEVLTQMGIQAISYK